MRLVYFIIFLCFESSSFLLTQGCMEGAVCLQFTKAHTGIVQYCYNISQNHSEWISVCGTNWTEHFSQITCRTLLNYSAPTQDIITSYHLGGEVNRSVELDCTGQATTVSECSSTIQTEMCSTVTVTCKGYCADNLCACSSGYETHRCEDPLCSPVCAKGGQCTFPNECTCTTGWEGVSCMTPICTPNCTSRSICIGPNTCRCKQEWTGNNCTQAVCTPECQNGLCTDMHMCDCYDGWNGTTCSQAVCISGCANGGKCVSPNQCNCTSGWQGDTCSTSMCSKNCSNGGICISHEKCSCEPGWGGDYCTKAECLPPCNNGNCTYPGICECVSGWDGPLCTKAICSDGFCKNDGNCSEPDKDCTCTKEWEGSRCQKAICSEGFCKNSGACLFPNINCTCQIVYSGVTCEKVRYLDLVMLSVTCGFLLLAFSIIIYWITIQCRKLIKKGISSRNPTESTTVNDNSQRISTQPSLPLQVTDSSYKSEGAKTEDMYAEIDIMTGRREIGNGLL